LYDVNQEAILRLKPDIVFTDGSQIFKEKKLFLEVNGIQILELPTRSLNDVFRNIEQIGKFFHLETRSKQLISSIKDSLRYYSEKIRTKKGDRNLKFLLVIGRNPGTLSGIYVAGKQTFLSDLFEMGGLKNVMEREGYFQINPERLVRKPIDLIIEIRAGADENLMKAMMNDWYSSPLLETFDFRVIGLNGDYVAVPGPRIYLILKEFYKKWSNDGEK
ncbi:MAG: hypothetical protein D6732_13550, partial [Methanobacteriota archaeon]